MELSFGARLRQQRERQQMSLAAFAEQSKIKLSLLEGLERDCRNTTRPGRQHIWIRERISHRLLPLNPLQ
jgi:transcriptional regulator with XRE-family HTH domain